MNVYHRCQLLRRYTGEQLIAGVNDTGNLASSRIFSDRLYQLDTADKHSFTDISTNFLKNSKRSNGILRGPGETDSWKKLVAENLVSHSLW